MTRNSRLPRTVFIAACLFACLMAGCSPVAQVEQPTITAYLPVESGKSAGQSFTARYDGLRGIAVYIKPETPGTGNLELQLSRSSPGGEMVAQSNQPISKVGEKGFYRFNFPPLDSSSRADYYLRLEMQGEGACAVGIAPADSYTNGAAYRNDAPEDAQMAFRLIYERRALTLGLAGEVLEWLELLLAAAALYLLPGWGLLSFLYPGWSERRWPEKIGLAAGGSLVIYPLLYLETNLVGLHLGVLYAWLPVTVSLIYLSVKTFRTRKATAASPPDGSPARAASRGEQVRAYLAAYGAADLGYLAAAVLVIAARFWAVRTLDLPMWGDSYHHSLVVQLLLDHSGLFDSWAPYAEMQTFTYHFGFHTLAATLSYLSGLSASASTLWGGQLINILAVLSLYPLAARIGRSPWSGVAAVLLAGMLAPVPMTYTNWGRYTQLAGQVILAASVFLAWDVLDDQKSWRRSLTLVGILLGGLALTHLRVLILAILFLLAYLILQMRSGRFGSAAGRVLIIGLIAGALFLPWFIHTYSGQIMAIFTSQITTPASQVVSGPDQTSGVGNLFDYLPGIIWLLLPVLIGIGLWRRDRTILLVAIWWLLAWIAGEPGWYGLPGTGAVTTFAVLIAAYIPAALFYAAAAGWGMQALQTSSAQTSANEISTRAAWRIRLVEVGLVAAVVWASVWAFGIRQADIQISEHALALRPDMRAAAWIQSNLPPETRFLVNADLVYSESTTVGTDGGWWLPLTAGRQTTIPPMNYSFEKEPYPGYRQSINDVYLLIDELGIENPAVLNELRKRGVTHVYIGQQQGSVGFFGVHTFDLDALEASSDFSQVYAQDRVRIFEVLPE